MWLKELCQRCLDRPRTSRHARPQAARRRGVRLRLEQLEDRTVPSSFTAATVSDLMADINAANQSGGSNTIALVAGNTFALTAVDNSTDGATGLPVIAANDNLSILGNGDTIARSTAKGTPDFRLFDVASGGALTLANLTLQGGIADGAGGAIDNLGSLTLNGVTVQNNIAQGSKFGAAGGGIFSSGSLTLQDCTVQNNQALGANGTFTGDSGSPALGGGLYVSGGTASLTNVTLYDNTAQGGDGANGGRVKSCGPDGCSNTFYPHGNGGNGLGGGMYVAGGTVSLHNTTVDHNSAVAGNGGHSALAEGGGIYIAVGASVCLDAFTLAHVINNTASTGYPDIYGAYTICP